MASLLSVTETASELGITRARVLVLIAEKRLPAEKIGSQWVVQVKDLAKVRNRKPGRPRTKKGK